MDKIDRSFTWYEVRTPYNASMCKGTHYQFTLIEARAFLKEVQARHTDEEFQIVKVSTKEKTVK